MMLILIMVLKFKQLANLIGFEDVIILKTIKTGSCHYLGHGAEIQCVEVTNDADFDYSVEI